MSVDPGEGWRLLEVGERIEEGDQNRWSNGEWREAHSGFIGWQISSPYDPWRRRVPAATADDIYGDWPAGWAIGVASAGDSGLRVCTPLERAEMTAVQCRSVAAWLMKAADKIEKEGGR
jgi:hypothetical protein